MSGNKSKPAVESKWSNALEYAVFGFPAMVAIACLLALYVFIRPYSGVNPLAGLVAMLTIVSFVGGFVLSVLIAVSLYFDARRVTKADVAWDPSPIIYAVAGLFLSGLVALHYLYRRYEYTASSSAWYNWWYGVATCFGLLVVASAATVLPIPLTVAALTTIFLSAGVLPVAIYKDAVHVRGRDGDWLPNPVNYFLAIFVGSVLFVVPIGVTGYYLYKRHRHVGTP